MMNRSWQTRKIGAVLVALLAGLLVACGAQAPAGPKIRVEDAWSRPASAMAMEEATAGEMHMHEESGGETHMHEESTGGEMHMHGMGSTGVVYLTLINEGREADRLISAASDVAETVEFHETKMEGDVMKMQPLPEGIEVPAGGQVELKPGGYHIMLINLKRDLKVGDRFTVTLEFEKSGTLNVEVEVREP